MSSYPGIIACLSLVTVATIGGCADPLEPATNEKIEDTAEVSSAFTEENALLPNAIIPNAIIPNAIIPNAIIPNALLPGALDPGALAALRDSSSAGDLSRMFLRYAAGCALGDGQAFNFRWMDADGDLVQEVYPGVMGLAPQWAWGPLDASGQRLVSACVAARTNFYGTPVTISLRSSQGALSAPSTAELGANPKIEGAFWGNLFSAAPRLRACYLGKNAANSRAWKRDCANGHLDGQGGTQDCGIIEIVGDCETICDPLDPSGQFFPNCNDPELGRTGVVVTTGLPIAAGAATTANLKLTDTAPSTMTLGACNTLSRTLTVTNNGDATAVAPLVSDSLPSGMAFVSAAAATGSCSASGSMVVCTLADLAPGASATVVIQTRPTVWNRTLIDSANVASSTPDADTSDNKASAGTFIAPPATVSADRLTTTFNGAPINKGSVLWLSADVTAGNLPAGATSIWTVGGTVSFYASGIYFNLPIPAGKVTFDPAAASASTTYDNTRSQWVTVAPKGSAGAAFLSGVTLIAPLNLPGGITNVTWSAHLVSNQPGVTATWRLGAAVYGAFAEGYKSLQIQPTNDAAASPYHVAHRAGTPEGFLAAVLSGACDGTTNYTGSCGSPVVAAPEVQACP